jgi:hypothetical protein
MCNEQNGFAFGLWIICVFMDIFFKCGIDLRLVLALEMGSLLLVARCTDVRGQAMLRSAGARRLIKTLKRCPAGAKIAQRIASWT